jgi:hypothetical protein
MLRKSWFLTAGIGLLLLIPASGADSAGTVLAPPFQRDLKEELRKRMERNHYELINLMKMDSVGWVKTLAVKKPNESLSQLQKERQQRKTAALNHYCEDSRFRATAEIDSLPDMAAADKAYCKERVRSLNPKLP